MTILQLLYYFLILVLLWVMVPWIIRTIVEKKIGDAPVLVKHEYNKNQGRFLYELKMTVWHYRIMQRALVCNMRYELATVDKQEITDEIPSETSPANPEDVLGWQENMPVVRMPHVQDEQRNHRSEYWTNASTADINMRGYKPVERLHDTLLWWRVPQFLMLTDAYKFDVPDDPELYPQHTPATMDNKFKSQNYWEFVKKLFAKPAMRDMDAHSIFMVMIIIAGAVAGLWMMGIF